MGLEKGVKLQSWHPHNDIRSWNICHQSLHNGEYRKGLHR